MRVKKGNIFLSNTKESLPYGSKSGGGGNKKWPIIEDRLSHSDFITKRLEQAYKRSEIQKQAAAIKYKDGVYLEFSGESKYDLAVKSLENVQQGIRLLTVKHDEESETTKAVVYIPSGKESYFLKKVEEYSTEFTKDGNPKNNSLISSISDIKIAVLDSFWIGNVNDMPNETPVWCEVWIRDDIKLPNKANSNFLECCNLLSIEVEDLQLRFPERIVRLVKANNNQLLELIIACDYIAEIRRAPEPTSFFGELNGKEQKEWCEELLSRTEFRDSNCSICILDTGVNIEHPLILPAIKNSNCIQALDDWSINDTNGHGTNMAGIAIYNNLKERLMDNDSLVINHKIESVKILHPRKNNAHQLYGAVTEQAVSLAEISNPNSNRVLCMAVTAREFNTDDGSPTSWSAAIDNITSGANENNEKRLFFISAGNVYPDELSDVKYPESNILHRVENPGQSWNAITVGAVSNNIDITDPLYNGFMPVADVGELSPYSSTSVMWNKKWPIKPEILLDGGNMATNGDDYTECEDLSLLTTHVHPLTHLFTTIGGTSSATAQASWMAAQINAEYPTIWPETVRALLIHSATWTDKMKAQFCQDNKKSSGKKNLLRSCGYGIPDLNRAIQCMNNSVNLIIEDEMQPYIKEKGANPKMNEMHLHKIPWPKEVLEDLGNEKAIIKVTLSYFIEPGPGEVGWKDKYRYPSCGLRFDLINSNETLEDFQKRVNVKMRGEDEKDSGDGSSRDWYLGTTNRDVGSIHSDFCEDSAVNLCDANYIAVYPIVGWWRERAYLGKVEEKIRYSLIVSIETPEKDVDLYTPIINQIESNIGIELPV